MKIYLINICAAITLCLAALTSCNTDAEGTIYDINGEELAFASTQMNVEVTAADNGIIRVPVYRGNTSTESTANISMDYSKLLLLNLLNQNRNLLKTLSLPRMYFSNHPIRHIHVR